VLCATGSRYLRSVLKRLGTEPAVQFGVPLLKRTSSRLRRWLNVLAIGENQRHSGRAYLACRAKQMTEDELEQRRLAGVIRADERRVSLPEVVRKVSGKRPVLRVRSYCDEALQRGDDTDPLGREPGRSTGRVANGRPFPLPHDPALREPRTCRVAALVAHPATSSTTSTGG
jgi:hypothetical protein